MTIKPTKRDWTVYQGAAFSKNLTWKDSAGNPIDLTGYTAAMQAREKVTDTTTFIDIDTDAGITLGGALGTIDIVLTAATTAAITVKGGDFDLKLIPASGEAGRLVYGTITVSPEVTR
jgi:hypothetical protein